MTHINRRGSDIFEAWLQHLELEPDIRGIQNLNRDNFILDSTHQAGQFRHKERNTGEHRELQADGEIQGCKTPPHKPRLGPPTGPLLREGQHQGLVRAQEAGGPQRRPQGQLIYDFTIYFKYMDSYLRYEFIILQNIMKSHVRIIIYE